MGSKKEHDTSIGNKLIPVPFTCVVEQWTCCLQIFACFISRRKVFPYLVSGVCMLQLKDLLTVVGKLAVYLPQNVLGHKMANVNIWFHPRAYFCCQMCQTKRGFMRDSINSNVKHINFSAKERFIEYFRISSCAQSANFKFRLLAKYCNKYESMWSQLWNQQCDFIWQEQFWSCILIYLQCSG